MSKLDYCNVAFAGLPRCELDRLQSVINAAERHSRGTASRPHHAVARRSALVADPSTHPVQTLCTGFQLRAWVRAEISTRDHPSGREH